MIQDRRKAPFAAEVTADGGAAPSGLPSPVEATLPVKAEAGPDSERLLVRIYGDSLSMPRAEHGVTYRKSYAELLRARVEELFPDLGVDLYNRARGGAPIAELFQLFKDDARYFGTKSGVVVIQCGIVDCAPRPLPPRLRTVVGRMPRIIRTRIVRFLHDNRAAILRAGLGSRITGPDPFDAMYREWVQRAADACSRVYLLNIAPTTDATERHSPGLTASIVRYNEIIEQAASVAANVTHVNVFGAIEASAGGIDACISADDGHHITLAGHELYASLLLEHEQQRLKAQGSLAAVSRWTADPSNPGAREARTQC